MKDLVNRYVAVWNEPDPDRRRAGISELWARDGGQILEPPQEVREAADRMRMTSSFRVRGHAELEERVTRAYEEFIAPGEFVFRPRDGGTRVDDVVTFRWELVRQPDGEVMAVGLEFLLLDGDGRIRDDYQFIER